MAFLPDNTGLQQLINQSTESAQKGISNAFDTAYQLKLQEQSRAKELFETLVKANPELGAVVAAQNPDMLTALTNTPPLFQRGEQKQGPKTESGKGPGRVPIPTLGAQVSEGFDKAKKSTGFGTEKDKPNEVRLALESASKMVTNAVAGGAKIDDPQAFLHGWSKAILDGRLPQPKDVGLSDADFARVIATPEAKNLDALSELARLFREEHQRPPSFEETRSLIAMVLPGTDENTIALMTALREANIENTRINNERASEALNDARNGQKLTLGKMTDAQKYISENKPIIDTIQKIDALWDAAVKGDKKARNNLLVLIPTLWQDAETRGAAAEIGMGRFNEITRKELNGLVARRIPALLVYEHALATGRQPRGGTGTIKPESDPESDVMKELQDQGLTE